MNMSYATLFSVLLFFLGSFYSEKNSKINKTPMYVNVVFNLKVHVYLITNKSELVCSIFYTITNSERFVMATLNVYERITIGAHFIE